MADEYWAHPTRDHTYIRPDGSELLFESRQRKAALEGASVVSWPDHAKIAAPLLHDTEKVVTGRNVVLDRKEAKRAGFKIDASEQSSPRSSWRASIYALAEAQDRPSATAELLTTQTPETLSVDAARAFLRGLPLETEHAEEEVMTADIDPRAARRAEIQGSMRAFNASRGHAVKPMQGAVDPAKVQRLAEIRFNAMMQNGKAHTTEAKTLKLALDTHATTGAPMDRTLASLGFDVSKLFVTR